MAAAATPYDQVIESALHLSLEDRSRLASRLLESLDEDEVSDAWKNELNDRLQQLEEGRAVLIPHAEVISGARARLAQQRFEPSGEKK